LLSVCLSERWTRWVVILPRQRQPVFFPLRHEEREMATGLCRLENGQTAAGSLTLPVCFLRGQDFEHVYAPASVRGPGQPPGQQLAEAQGRGTNRRVHSLQDDCRVNPYFFTDAVDRGELAMHVQLYELGKHTSPSA
jgi:hypothetical protein